MFELRWAQDDISNDKPLATLDGYGYKLQYRTATKMNFAREEHILWTEWQDVPVEEE